VWSKTKREMPFSPPHTPAIWTAYSMMRQLSELDASFLYLESEATPMHMGGVYLFDNSGRDNALSYDEFYQYIESRLHLASFFRQRLVEVPLNLDHPYWVDDPEFDLSRHLRHITLEHEGSEPQLIELAATLLAEPLPRDRPLWEISFVDGLASSDEVKAPFALIVKVHHAAIDAITGEEAMGSLLDFSPKPRKIAAAKSWRPEPLPSKACLLGNAYSSALHTPFRLANLAKDTVAGAFYALLLQRLKNLNLPPALFSAPMTFLNKPVSQDRALGYTEFSLERFKKIKHAHSGITLNDLVMAVCAETLRGYLEDAGKLPKTPLIAMSPISVRSKNLRSPTGKQISAMLISLATHEPNPALRLKRIHDNAVASKIYSQAISAGRLTQLIPSTMIGLSARIYTEFQLAQRHKPLFNLPIINIPGPQTPLYLNGAKLVRQIGSAPLFDGVGLVFVVVSYNSKVTFSVTSCPKVLDNMDDFMARIPHALEALEQALEGADLEELARNAEETDPLARHTSVMGGLIEDIAALFSNLFNGFFTRNDKQDR
jgi:diacylglycerol O-acyltransferase / wax synthase